MACMSRLYVTGMIVYLLPITAILAIRNASQLILEDSMTILFTTIRLLYNVVAIPITFVILFSLGVTIVMLAPFMHFEVYLLVVSLVLGLYAFAYALDEIKDN